MIQNADQIQTEYQPETLAAIYRLGPVKGCINVTVAAPIPCLGSDLHVLLLKCRVTRYSFLQPRPSCETTALNVPVPFPLPIAVDSKTLHRSPDRKRG